MCEPKQCGWCQDGWPRFQLNGKVFHSVPEPQSTVPCEDQVLLFAMLSSIKPGDRLIADDGFTCLSEGHVATVREDEGADPEDHIPREWVAEKLRAFASSEDSQS